jgi:Flp pilus assembly protein TadD
MALAATKQARTPEHSNASSHGAGPSALIFCLILAAITLVLYNPVSHFPFLNYDDNWYIIQNPHIRAGLTWSTIKWALTATILSNWHPLTWMSHAIDYQLFGLNPAGYHYINLLLHVVNAMLLFVIFDRETGYRARSLIVALFFAIHPVNVESVAWISERKNVLSMALFLLALMAYGWYTRKPAIRPYLVVCALFACGLMAKPQIVTFPFVLLLWDFWPLHRFRSDNPVTNSSDNRSARPFWWLVAEKIPMLLLSAASCILTMKVQTAALNHRHPVGLRIANAIVSYFAYIREAVWPSGLAPLYPYPTRAPALGLVTVALTSLLMTTTLVLWQRRTGYLPVAWFWFLGTLIPTIGLVQVGLQARADRYAYAPFIGLFVIFVWGIGDALHNSPIPGRASASAALALCVAAALMASTHRQLGYWSANETLWSHTIQVTDANFVAEDSLGDELITQGRPDDAIVHFRRAVEINSEDPVGNLNVAAYDQQHGRFDAAIARYRKIPGLTSTRRLVSQAFTNLGYLYRQLGRYSEAQTSFESALNNDPDNSAALVGLGLQAHNAGDMRQAIGFYARAVSLQANAVGYVLLARALEQARRHDDAIAAISAAQKLPPSFADAQKIADKLLSAKQ